LQHAGGSADVVDAGTFIGGFADKYGRKFNCILFCVLYGLSCLTKHSSSFYLLLVGRLLGGVATSILYSAFETWMISEHKSNGFDVEWMQDTFSTMTFGSGLVAIIAGLVASVVASNIGMVAPFDVSFLLLAGGGIIIFSTWKENYGETPANAGAGGSSVRCVFGADAVVA
jgi:MFS family permease